MDELQQTCEDVITTAASLKTPRADEEPGATWRRRLDETEGFTLGKALADVEDANTRLVEAMKASAEADLREGYAEQLRDEALKRAVRLILDEYPDLAGRVAEAWDVRGRGMRKESTVKMEVRE